MAEEIVAEIIDALGSTHLWCEVKQCSGQPRLKIFGNYAPIAELWIQRAPIGSGYTITTSMFRNFAQNDIAKCVDAIIKVANTEIKPDIALEKKFYEDNFPCLAAEVDYSYYHGQYYSALKKAAIRGCHNRKTLQLQRFDYNAFKRKMHAALDGSLLPSPIRGAIIGAFDAGAVH